MAPPLKLTPEIQTQIVNRLTAGSYFDTAVVAAGIGKRSGNRWMERGRDAVARLEETAGEPLSLAEIEEAVPAADRVYVAFVHACEEAMATAEVSALAQLRRGERGWQAQGWFLERRYKERWRRQSELLVPAAADRDEQRTSLEQIREELADVDVEALMAEVDAARSDAS